MRPPPTGIRRRRDPQRLRIGRWRLGRISGFGIGATGWWGKGLGTAMAVGNTAIDDAGSSARTLAIWRLPTTARRFRDRGLLRFDQCQETAWDAIPRRPNARLSAVIKEVRGIGGKIAYHVGPVTFSVDGMNIHNTWHRGESQTANVVSGGLIGEW